MGSTSMRRSATAVATLALTLAGLPLLGATASAATPPPAFQPSSSTPVPSGAVIVGSEKITAAFDQAVTGTQNSMKVYERNADGSRGYQLPGTVSFSPNSLSGAAGTTVSWSPASTLVASEYEVVVNATGVQSDGKTADPTRPATADYDYFVAGKAAPSGLTAPQVNGQPLVNNQNASAAPFSGTAAPDLTITVTVAGKDAQSGFATTKQGSAKVAPCGSVHCSFSVPVDVSGLADGTLTWSAVGTESEDSKATTGTGTGPSVVKDTTAPAAPVLSASPAMTAAHSATLKVPSATDSSSDVASYLITVRDQDGHSVTTPVAGSSTMPAQQIDVSTLDDGTLSVAVQAQDAHGNLSTACCANQFGQQSTPTVTKDVGLQPNAGTSTVTTPAGTISYAEATSHGIQVPTSIDVEFTNPIVKSYTDTSTLPNQTHDSSACFASPSTHQCVLPSIPGSNITASSTGRGLVIKVPAGLDPNGAYELSVTTYPKNFCPDSGGGFSNCQPSSGIVSTSAGASVLQLDSTAPTITFTQADNPITASNLQTATVAGTVDSDVSAVQMTLVSSNAPTRPRVQSLTTSAGSGASTFSSSPLPLSGMVDGLLTVTVKATDAAGNSKTAQQQIVLNALGLVLVPGDGKLLVTWTKPTLPNNAAPTYTLSYRDQSVPNAPIQTLTPAPASTATSALLGGLVDGHDYGVTLTATDAGGDGPVAVADATPKGGARISLSAPRLLTYGTTTTLKGRLAHGGTGIAGAAVTLTPFYGRKAGAPLRLKTDSTGAFSAKVKPLKTVSYVASFAGSTAYDATTTTKRVGLRVNIRITKVSGSTLSGSVAPNMRGRTVYIYEIVKKKSVKVGTARLGSKSTWTFRHAWKGGTHYVFARFLTQNSYYGNNSAKVKLTR